MKLKSFHWTRRTAVYALIALAVVLTLLVIWRSNDGVLSAHYNVTTTEGRITYLRALGWEADPATETAQEIVLPRTFDGVFGDYNALQKQQGFDLSIYAGETCSVYTYRVTNYAGTSDTVLAQLVIAVPAQTDCARRVSHCCHVLAVPVGMRPLAAFFTK